MPLCACSYIFSSLQISKAIDKVITLQRGYIAETVRRCRQKPTCPGNNPHPARFEGFGRASSTTMNDNEGLDIRILDHDTIEMASMSTFAAIALTLH